MQGLRRPPVTCQPWEFLDSLSSKRASCYARCRAANGRRRRARRATGSCCALLITPWPAPSSRQPPQRRGRRPPHGRQLSPAARGPRRLLRPCRLPHPCSRRSRRGNLRCRRARPLLLRRRALPLLSLSLASPRRLPLQQPLSLDSQRRLPLQQPRVSRCRRQLRGGPLQLRNPPDRPPSLLPSRQPAERAPRSAPAASSRQRWRRAPRSPPVGRQRSDLGALRCLLPPHLPRSSLRRGRRPTLRRFVRLWLPAWRWRVPQH